MKEEKVLYLGIITKPGDPDSGYMKLYPKADGWYSLDSSGNEVKLEGVIIIDENSQELTQKNKLEFAAPFTSAVSGDKIVVSLDALGFDHDNTFHTPDFATEANLTSHEDDETTVHGLDVPDINTKIHAQNTDTALDQGGANEVTAAELKGTADLVKDIEITIDDETNKSMVASERMILSRSSVEQNVNYTLPTASAMPDKDIVVRKDKWDNYALVVQTGGGEDLYYNSAVVDGVTTDDIGAWIMVKSDGSNWFVIMDSGNWAVKV